MPAIDTIRTGIGTQIYVEGDYRLRGSNEIYPLGVGTVGIGLIQNDLGAYMENGECVTIVYFYAFDEEEIGKTLDYRIWGYYDESAAKNIDIGTTSNIAKPKLTIDSDYNYPRFIGDGWVSQGQTYTHNLGYIPLVKAWIKTKAWLDDETQVDYFKPSGTDLFFGNPESDPFRSSVIQVTNTQIKTFRNPDSENIDKTYFRMYKL